MRLEVEMSRYLKVEEESNLIDIHINFILKNIQVSIQEDEMDVFKHAHFYVIFIKKLRYPLNSIQTIISFKLIHNSIEI